MRIAKLNAYGFVAVIFGALTSFSALGGADETPSFDPVRGFKPAQRDLTEIYLQIAGSLEYYGSPVPYMQHMASEHKRIEALYLAKYGTATKSLRPTYMTDAPNNRIHDTMSHNKNQLPEPSPLIKFAISMVEPSQTTIHASRNIGANIVKPMYILPDNPP